MIVKTSKTKTGSKIKPVSKPKAKAKPKTKTKPKDKSETKTTATKKVTKPKKPKPIGLVTHYFAKIKVVIVKFNKPVTLNTVIHFQGATSNLTMPIQSMQYDHQPIKATKKGQEVGIKVKKRLREGDQIFEIL